MIRADSRIAVVFGEPLPTWRFLPWVGLGLQVLAVPNKLANYRGISLALDVGRLR